MPATSSRPGASLEVDDLHVAFAGADRPALDGVGLRARPGEIVALLGPSGCGKTTLLRAVAGLVEPAAGSIALDGDDLTGVPVHRRGIGLMFQDYALFPHRDVAGNVEFGLRMAGEPAAARRARVAEVLALVGMEGWEDRAVGPLSGGERQRVALARALAPAPRLLLLDEPLGALDRNLRDRLVPELGDLFRRVGVTVVHVTHDQEEALALADRVVVMDNGRVVQEGTPEDLWARPATPFVARFLGFANVTDGADGARLVRPEAVLLSPAAPGAGSAAEVTSVLFHGGRSSVTVRLADGSFLEASVPTGAGERWQVGDRVLVEVDPAGVQRLGRQGPAGEADS